VGDGEGIKFEKLKMAFLVREFMFSPSPTVTMQEKQGRKGTNMIVIDVIKILENRDLFSVIVTRYDTKWIGSRASLAGSLEAAEMDVQRKCSVFGKIGRRVKVRWRREGGAA
jgi:hypothetical protein